MIGNSRIDKRNVFYMIKRLSIFVCLIVLSVLAYAVPATPHPITITLADGSTQEFYLHGDENGSYHTRLDGTPVRIEDGVVIKDMSLPKYYQQQQRKQEVARTAPSELPLVGSPRALVILMEYQDLSFVVNNPREAFSNMMNQSGYNANGGTGSVRDYYIASSDNVFAPIFDVVGPYKADNNMAYYGRNNDANVHDLVREACRKAYEAGVDFSLYDNDKDGEVDNIFLYYAGHNEAEGAHENTIWPHRHGLYTPMNLDGLRVQSYMCTSELRGSGGKSMAGIGTFCHEFGHVLGLPDLYDTQNSRRYTVGFWDLMCSGSYNNNGNTPPVLSAFERFMLGWLVPEQLQGARSYRLAPLETSNKAYLIAATEHNLGMMNPSPNEYFLVENRQPVGWDAVQGTLPGKGLLISHITFSAAKWNMNTFNNGQILCYDIVEAYNRNPSSSMASDTYPGSFGVVTMTPILNSGDTLHDARLLAINQLPDMSVSFHFGPTDDSGFSFQPASLPLMVTTFDRQAVEYQEESLTIVGKGIADSVVEISTSDRLFEFSPDNGETWYRDTLVFVDTVQADSSYNRTLLVRHSPVRRNCKEVSAVLDIVTRNWDNLQMNQLVLRGTSPRPIYLQTPSEVELVNVTPTSFEVQWKEEEDAEFYYVTLYTKEDKVSEVVQDFENIKTVSAWHAIGWDANFLSFSTVDRYDGQRALYFNQSGQYIQTEAYKEAVSTISFWISNNYNDETSGVLTLLAKNITERWDTVATIQVKRNTKNVILDYAFPTDSVYVQFKLAYEHNGTKGGVLLDTWTATMDKQIHYLYKTDEYVLYAPKKSLTFTDLKWGETYYFQLQALEEKGCEPYLTPLTAPLAVTTMVDTTAATADTHIYGATKDKQLTVVQYSHDQLVAYLPYVGQSGDNLYLYSMVGNLVATIPVSAGGVQLNIPVQGLNKGEMYLLKYVPANETMKRKHYWGKFVW